MPKKKQQSLLENPLYVLVGAVVGLVIVLVIIAVLQPGGQLKTTVSSSTGSSESPYKDPILTGDMTSGVSPSVAPWRKVLNKWTYDGYNSWSGTNMKITWHIDYSGVYGYEKHTAVLVIIPPVSMDTSVQDILVQELFIADFADSSFKLIIDPEATTTLYPSP